MRIICWNTQGSRTGWKDKQFKQMLETFNADVGILLEPPSNLKSENASRRSGRNAVPELEDPKVEWKVERQSLKSADVNAESVVYFAREGVQVKLAQQLDKANVYSISKADLGVKIAFTHVPFSTADASAFTASLQKTLSNGNQKIDILMGDVNCYGLESSRERGSKRKRDEAWEVKLQSQTGKAKSDATLDRVYQNADANVKVAKCGRIFPSAYPTRLPDMSQADSTRGNEDLKLELKNLSDTYFKSDHFAIYADVVAAGATSDADSVSPPASKRQRRDSPSEGGSASGTGASAVAVS